MKRKIWGFVMFLVLLTASLQAQNIKWLTSYDQAFAQSKATGKSVLVLITAPSWCGYCVMFEDNVLSQASVQRALNEGFIPLMILDTNPERNKFQFRGYPTVRVYDKTAVQVADVYTQDSDRFLSMIKNYSVVTPAGTTASAAGSQPAASAQSTPVNWKEVKNVAQYGQGDWSQEIRREKGLTAVQAQKIAEADPRINFFFITTGIQMVLDTQKGQQVFRKGDAVFFGGKPWYGTAPGLADAYEKVASDLSNGSTKYTYDKGYFTLLNEGRWQHCDEAGVCTLFKETDLSDASYFILYGPVKQSRDETWVALPKSEGASFYYDLGKSEWVNLAAMKVEIKSKSLPRAKSPLPKVSKGAVTFQEPRRD